MTNQRFEALSRMCLNNWHYIRHKVLLFHDGINFFTGHSGSGKSTVIDALQIVLYANTDGRGFFNKAAADDSDRTLIEYLRGMINIGEDNRFSYLRNQNFSSTIALELRRTDTGECQCVGVVFDVETSTNEVSRMFFWHKGELPEHHYCAKNSSRTMSTEEVKSWLLQNFAREDCYYGSHNERFRKQLYDIYLGGLDAEKFPLLFKRAIPFRMNIKLEDFVKEYICMEQDIHIEDMQLSVMEYGRMRKKIEDTCKEIERLKVICNQHGIVEKVKNDMEAYGYYAARLDILQDRRLANESQEKIRVFEENHERTLQDMEQRELEMKEITEKEEELLRRISMTGYEQLREQLAALNDLVERLASSKARWEQTAQGLAAWEDEESVSNRILWDIEEFKEGTISKETLERLQNGLKEQRKDVMKQQQEAQSEIRQFKKSRVQAAEELEQLKIGNKAYPRELDEARTILQNRLYQETGKSVSVEILADLLDIRDEQWRSAVEGYMANNKLSLIVEPKYARTAMKIYQELNKEKYHQVAVIDTERVLAERHTVLEHALAEEVVTGRDDVRAYVDFLLGKVVKCADMDELRKCRIGITKDCILYHNYRIQYINPAHYTKFAYIGKSSLRQRIRLLEKEIAELDKKQKPLLEIVKEADRVLTLEYLGQDKAVYLEWKQDMDSYQVKTGEQKRLREKLDQMKSQNVEEWENERRALIDLREQHREVQRQQLKCANGLERDIADEKERLVLFQERVIEKENKLTVSEEREDELREILKERAERRRSQAAVGNGVGEPLRYDVLRTEFLSKLTRAEDRRVTEMNKLVDLRSNYLRTYQNRNFSPTAEDNEDYQKLYDSLNFDNLDEYRKRAAEQAKTAVEHFKDDFMYKIRSAIQDAMLRKDELNRIISRLNFGKDRYQFYIGKNKGPDGQYYDMFMDEALEVNPSDLDIGLDNQLNMFTMEHENHYGPMINDLINIFIPPENATPEEMEEAKRNMDKYADYRTYLSFDMQQLIQNEDETIKIRLSKMIKKNSGGEGQNPLYVALLASFAQAYKIDLKPGLQRNPTIRLVVLDEAFSKMDAEKVASCIQLIRGLGFQALISATNDKIQNYLETVDKIFVFANPNKKAISIQEFERKEFEQLRQEEEPC